MIRVVKARRVGDSIVVSIPSDICESLKINAEDFIVMVSDKTSITLRKEDNCEVVDYDSS